MGAWCVVLLLAGDARWDCQGTAERGSGDSGC